MQSGSYPSHATQQASLQAAGVPTGDMLQQTPQSVNLIPEHRLCFTAAGDNGQ